VGRLFELMLGLAAELDRPATAAFVRSKLELWGPLDPSLHAVAKD